ncbi:MAG: hypothetical protein Q9173_002391, partial [Seirophora scorigena]
MAPTSAKRITRSAKANQSGKAASKRKDESIDSGYGGSGRLSRTASPSDNGEPVLPRKKPRTATHNVRDTSPGKSMHRAELPGLATSLHTTRKNPRKLTPKKKDQFTAVIPEEAPHDDLMSPVDRPVQSVTVATTQFQQSLDWEAEHVRRMFSTPRSRSEPQQMQLYFNTPRTYPSTDEAFKQRYQALRNAAWKWAQDSFPVTDAPLDLMHLARHAPELMEYINATTAGPCAGAWERLVSSKRAEIVYSILGKALEVHIFGEELFGAAPQQKRKLQMADREMFDAD